MTWLTILKAIAVAVSTFVTTCLPVIIALVKAIKARKEAQTEAQKTAATNEMLDLTNQLINSAEHTWQEVNGVLKNQGSSAGAIKKEIVMTKLQAHALQNGYEWNADFWSEKIDEIVSLTKSVNVK